MEIIFAAMIVPAAMTIGIILGIVVGKYIDWKNDKKKVVDKVKDVE
jgi:hypothetical protein